MSRSRLIVFDLDGTLVDSRRDLAESANTLLAEHGCRTLDEHAIGRMVGDGAATLVARAFAAAGCPPSSEALPQFLSIYNSRLLRYTRPYQGVPELLGHLHTRATLAVLTNKPIRATRHILDGLDLARYFDPDRVRGGDGPLARKPDPAGLDRLIAEAGVERTETAMVGDSHVDFRTARAANVRVCIVRYGFGYEGFPNDELRPDDRLVDHPDELLDL